MAGVLAAMPVLCYVNCLSYKEERIGVLYCIFAYFHASIMHLNSAQVLNGTPSDFSQLQHVQSLDLGGHGALDCNSL